VPPSPRPPLRELVRAFAWIGAISFGGGRTAYFQDELVTRRRWLTTTEFLESVALSQMLPGPGIGNLSACLGQRLGGWRGALLAVACLTLPGGAMTLGVAWLYFRGLPTTLTAAVGMGVSAASVGLALGSVVRLRAGIRDLGGFGIVAITFVLFGLLHWPIHWVLLAALPPALVLAWRRRQ
jgi:chromate transporter